ncbi:Serine/threonine-protein kinase rio2, partial [Conglomerata obtusa]
FNEFNVMINAKEEIIVIDFPQCVSIESARANDYLKRDIEAVKTFFKKKFNYTNEFMPILKTEILFDDNI